MRIELEGEALISPEQIAEILDINEALESLATLDRRKVRVVGLKYVGGPDYDEIAEALKVSVIPVWRESMFSKAWLHSELEGMG